MNGAFVHISQVHMWWLMGYLHFQLLKVFLLLAIHSQIAKQPWCLWKENCLSTDANSEQFQQNWTTGNKKKSLDPLNTVPGNLETQVGNQLVSVVCSFLFLSFSSFISVFSDYYSLESRYLGPFIWGKWLPQWIPESGRFPGEGNGNPLPYSSLGNPMAGYSPRGCKGVKHILVTE